MSYENRIRSNTQSVQKLLDENTQLIQAIVDYQNKGKAVECAQYQQLLHKNLVYLASLADTSHNIQAMIPPPPSGQIQGNASPSMGMQGGGSTLPTNQERKLLGPNPMDQSTGAMPGMQMPQGITSGAQMPGVMSSGSAMTPPEDMSSVGPFGGASGASIGVQPMKPSSTPPVTGFPGSTNQMVGSSMAPSTQSMLPGQQGYMPSMHPGQAMQQHQQGQQFMMQQNVPMGYNPGPVQQMHPSQQAPQQLGQQPYMSNQTVGNQQPPVMVPYQQPPTAYDPYNQMQNIPGYNNPYGQQ